MKALPATLLSAVATLAFSQGSWAQGAAPAPDNTATNKLERPGNQGTADEQSNSKSDIDLTQRIRRSVMEDDKLSVYGQNVKIVANNGRVTLNGVVRSHTEKSQIAAKAVAIAGEGKVHDELKIAPPN